jgi:hypothetical protein
MLCMHVDDNQDVAAGHVHSIARLLVQSYAFALQKLYVVVIIIVSAECELLC